jgi:hypothetical protein
MKDECCTCHRRVENCEVLILTPEEKKAIGKAAPEKLFYCKPCYRILTNRELGAQFLRGLAETGLRRAGVVGAEARATKFHQDLLSKVPKQ